MENLTLSGIVLAHHFIAPPGWVSDEYAFARQHHGIVYVLSGAAEYRMGSGETLLVRAGDCLYVPRGTVYVTRCSGAESFVHMTVNFDVVGSGRLFPVPTRLRFHTATRFEQLFSTLVRHWTTRHPYYRERCMGLLYEMAYLMLREASAAAPIFGKAPACPRLSGRAFLRGFSAGAASGAVQGCPQRIFGGCSAGCFMKRLRSTAPGCAWRRRPICCSVACTAWSNAVRCAATATRPISAACSARPWGKAPRSF